VVKKLHKKVVFLFVAVKLLLIDLIYRYRREVGAGRELQTTLYTYTKKGCGIFVFRMYIIVVSI
jgi:hypothetical protein